MKTIITLLVLVSAFTFSSCNKCYECSNSNGTEKICKGDWKYNLAKENTLTDENGSELNCR